MGLSFKTEAWLTLKLATPLIIGQASTVAMGFVDTLMAGRLSALDLAAVAVASTLWSSANLLVIGTLLAIPAFISQYDGAGQHHRMASFVRQAFWVALAMAAGVFWVVRQLEPLLLGVGIEADVSHLADAYLNQVAPGAFAWGGFLVLRFTSDGLGHTRPFMFIGILGFLINIPADYVFMYGKLGMPALGAEGCGLATALVLWSQFLAMLGYTVISSRYRFMNLFQGWEMPRLKAMGELLGVGLPIGASIFVESSMFMVATLLMGRLGTIAVAGHQIALNFAALMFMVPLGMAMAITVRVGNAQGRGQHQEARFRGLSGLALTTLTQGLSAAVMLLFPAAIAAIYTPDPEVAAVAISLLFYAAIFQLSDGIQAAAAGALRGIKDTRTPMVIIVLAYWVLGIPLSWWLGIEQGQRGPGIWIGLIIGLTVAAVGLGWRFHRKTAPSAPG